MFLKIECFYVQEFDFFWRPEGFLDEEDLFYAGSVFLGECFFLFPNKTGTYKCIQKWNKEV